MIGIDEVGRGSWAGPLLVCAVRLNKPVAGLKDSKKLTKTQRQKLSQDIVKNSNIGFGWVSAMVIDDIGLSESLKLASAKAVQEILEDKNEKIIIDGYINFLPDLNCQCIIRADDKIDEVSAASIIAKVSRDKYMQELSKKYPNYDFKNNVGYGTKAHKLAIIKNGYTEEHRRSFNIKLS